MPPIRPQAALSHFPTQAAITFPAHVQFPMRTAITASVPIQFPMQTAITASVSIQFPMQTAITVSVPIQFPMSAASAPPLLKRQLQVPPSPPPFFNVSRKCRPCSLAFSNVSRKCRRELRGVTEHRAFSEAPNGNASGVSAESRAVGWARSGEAFSHKKKTIGDKWSQGVQGWGVRDREIGAGAPRK